MRTHKTDTMLGFGGQILHEHDIHIPSADTDISFKYQDRIITELFLGLGSQRFDLLRQHILQT